MIFKEKSEDVVVIRNHSENRGKIHGMFVVMLFVVIDT
jgi:hypothetical protein